MSEIITKPEARAFKAKLDAILSKRHLADEDIAVILKAADRTIDHYKADNQRLRELLVEAGERIAAMLKAEWMVTHDWGGDRKAVLEATEATLAKIEEELKK